MGRAKLAFWLLFLRRLGVGLVLIYVAVVLTVGGTSTARPILYGLSCLWLVILTVSAHHHFIRQSWAEVIVTNIAVTLVMAESALQVWAMSAGVSLLVRDNLDSHRLIPGRDYGSGLYGNSRGYPGPEPRSTKPPGVIRLAALGDSFSLGPAVPFADNYLTRLSAELPGVEINNYGVSGAGPREYREILESDVWSVQPDVVLVAIFIGNDITESLSRPRRLDPRHYSLYLFCQRSWKLARAAWKSSAQPVSTAVDRLAMPALSPAIFREVEARRLAVCLKNTTSSMERKWQSALHDLSLIVQSCRRRTVPIVVVLIPDEFQVNDAVLEEASQEARLEREELDLDSPQRRLQAFFADLSVPCLDLLPAFHKVPDTYAPYDTHWNVTGNRLAAREIGTWLRATVLKTESD
jgi:hypothetical protein